MKKKLFILLSFLCFSTWLSASSAIVLKVEAPQGDATRVLQQAIDKAAAYRGKPVVIQLSQGDYHLYRSSASRHLYYISNTASAEEHPDPTKHIGLWLKGMKNVTIDGGGAYLITHGEMTSFVIDGCENIALRNFTLKADDPSVPEFTVTEVGADYLTVKTHDDSRFSIRDGKFFWTGYEWSFSGGIAQVFDPVTNITNRCESPLTHVVKAIELDKNHVRLNYDKHFPARVGEVYQMRHSIRTEACGFIHRSKNIVLEDLNIHFLGNFGIVGQYSENLTYNRIQCVPELGTERTCAGFADFVQMSGCRGKIRILNSRFEGAHDDPINIHGTHLKVVEYVGDQQLKVRFMHGQSYGFDAFFKGDQMELVDAHTLRCLQPAVVKEVKRLDEYEVLLTLNRKIDESIKALDHVAVENVTWTPEVEICHNYFSRIPTRGVLVTTRRKVVIAHNVFYRLPMSAVLVSDDARGWYESGPVKDVTIQNNLFFECGAPVVAITPENDRYDGPVHRNVRVLDNRFVLKSGEAVRARATDGLTVKGNYFVTEGTGRAEVNSLIRTEDCKEVCIERNYHKSGVIE